MRAMGLTMLAVVFLGPSVQPWYLAWSVVILATIAEHRLRVLVIVLSCVSCFFGLPGARKLVLQFGEANPILIVLASTAMIVLLAVPIVHEGAKSHPGRRGGEGPGTAEELDGPGPTLVPVAQSSSCKMATSIQRPNLRPISRSTPTKSKPHA